MRIKIRIYTPTYQHQWFPLIFCGCMMYYFRHLVWRNVFHHSYHTTHTLTFYSYQKVQIEEGKFANPVDTRWHLAKKQVRLTVYFKEFQAQSDCCCWDIITHAYSSLSSNLHKVPYMNIRGSKVQKWPMYFFCTKSQCIGRIARRSWVRVQCVAFSFHCLRQWKKINIDISHKEFSFADEIIIPNYTYVIGCVILIPLNSAAATAARSLK